jgi:hypothetical protein
MRLVARTHTLSKTISHGASPIGLVLGGDPHARFIHIEKKTGNTATRAFRRIGGGHHLREVGPVRNSDDLTPLIT